MRAKPAHPRGFTLFELMLVISIVGILAAALLNRVLWYQERAEKAAMEQMAGVVQSALNLQVAKLAAQDKLAEVERLALENPTNWLAKKPPNYRGEYFDPEAGKVPPGNWYYDLKSHDLVYLVERTENFMSGEDKRKWVRYRVKLVYNNNQHEIGGAVFEAAGGYSWFGG